MQTRKRNGRPVLTRSKAEISTLLAEYEKKKSEMSIPAFCELHQVGKSTFYSWQRKYSLDNQFKPRGKFIEVKPSIHIPSEPAGLVFASIKRGNIEVELRQYVEPGYLKALLS